MRLALSAAILSVTVLASACGSPPATTSPTPSSTAPAKETPKPVASATPTETPRKKHTRLIVEALAGDKDYKPDNHQSARIASEGLAEEDSYKLSSETRRHLHAVVGESIDSSQCSRILAELVFHSLEAETTQACGDAKALEKRLLATKSESDRTKEAAKACKVEEKMGFAAGTAITATALITSVVVGQTLAKDPTSDADEKSVARAIRYICDGSPSL